MPRQGPNPARSTELGLFRSRNGRRLILCLLLALTSIALYKGVTRASFLNVDDVAYVTENAHVRAGLTWDTFLWAFQTTDASNWHPVTWLSHALDCQWFGLNPAGPHAINMLLHAANAVLLFLLLENATGFMWRSLAVAALFALHPINVESVAWISERKNVLSMFFFLLALAAYGAYVRRPGILRYLAVTAIYAVALMTKPQVIAFPFALLLLDYWPLRRLAPAAPSTSRASFRALILEKIPWFALSAASAIVTMKVQAEATQIDLPLRFRLANAALAYAKYLGKAFWPVNLAPLYPHPQRSINHWAALLAAFLLVAFSAAVVALRRERPLFVGWFWFLGTLVPMIGLVQVGVQAMADRYAYIPLLGIFVVVVWGVADRLEAWRLPRALPAAALAVTLLVLGFALLRQVGFWKDNLTLWTHTLRITPPNYGAEDSLGTALVDSGRIDEAIPHFERAQSLRPDDVTAALNLAAYAQLRGNYQAALASYAKIEKITKIPLWRAQARVNSGYAHYSLKQYDLARQDFEAVLSEQPENAAANCGLGLLAQRAGNIPAATNFYARSVQFRPTPLTYLLLAQALEKGGRAADASQARARAAQLTPNLDRDLGVANQLLAN